MNGTNTRFPAALDPAHQRLYVTLANLIRVQQQINPTPPAVAQMRTWFTLLASNAMSPQTVQQVTQWVALAVEQMTRASAAAANGQARQTTSAAPTAPIAPSTSIPTPASAPTPAPVPAASVDPSPPIASTPAAPPQPQQPISRPTHDDSIQIPAKGTILLSSNPEEGYPVSATLNTVDPGHVQWPAARPTLTGGYAAGRVSGTPAYIARGPGEDSLNLDDHRTRNKTPGNISADSMRRTVQDLVISIDPNVKIEPEVEDLLLNIADEFIDSVTQFGCELAKHRGGEVLEVKDLQLHLERNHNIRIPGFTSDETRISLSQSAAAVPVPVVAKKGGQGTGNLRSQRLAQVQMAKREAKLM